MGNIIAISACHHKPSENMAYKQGMNGEDKKQNKRIQVCVTLVLELEFEEKILIIHQKSFI